MDNQADSVIQQCISKLQGLLGGTSGKSSSGQPKATAIPQFDSNLQKCLDKAKAISPELTALTSIYKEASQVMKAILGFSKVCPKYTPEQEEKLKQKIINISKQIDEIEKKYPEFSEHCKCFREIMQTTLWVFVPSPEFILKGSIESADFWALKFQRKKNLDHNDWYKLFQIAVRSLQTFVMEDYAMGLTFNFNGQNKWALLLEGSASYSQPVQKQVPQPGAPKSVPQPVSLAPVKKQPKKEILGQMCTIVNFENEKVELGPEQIQMKHGIFFENCKSTHLKIDAKFKSIVISRCEDVILEMKSCISGVQVVHSKNVKIYVHEKTPSISADASESINIVLNQANLNCDIVSAKTSELTVAYRKEDGSESKAALVSSQLVTKWDAQSKQFKTSVYDKFL